MPLSAYQTTDPALPPDGPMPSETTTPADRAELEYLREAIESADHAIALCQTIYDAGGQPVDFRCVVANALAFAHVGLSAGTLLSHSIQSAHLAGQRQPLLTQMLAAAESNQPHRFAYCPEPTGPTIQVSLVPRSGGLRLTATVQTPAPSDEPEPLLHQVVTGSNTLSVWDAVTDDAGQVIDFRGRFISPATAVLLGQVPDGTLLSQTLPPVFGQPLLGRLRAVYETGGTDRSENYHTGLDRWFTLTVTQLPQGVLMVVNDSTALKHQQQKLSDQASFYKAILNNVPAGISTLRPYRNSRGEIEDFIYVFANNHALTDGSRLEKRFLGNRLLQLFPNLRQDGTFGRLVAVMQTGQSQQFETKQERDGRTEWGELCAAAHGDYLICSFKRTTDQKQIRQALDRQNNIFEQVVAHSPAGITMLEAIRDPSGDTIVDFRYVLTNDCSARLSGHTAATMTGQRMSALFPGYESGNVFKTLVGVVESGEAVHNTFFYDRYGIRAWFEGHYVRQGDGTLFTFLDITAIKDAELEQQRQTEQLQSILDNSQTAISLHEAIRDASGAIVDFRTIQANQLAVKLWGPLAEVILHQPFSQVPNPTREADLTRYIRVVETGQAETIEYQYDSQTYLIATARSGDGVVVSFIDITDLRQSRQQLEAANRELARSNESLQQFAFVASHDLQEPLRKITTFGDRLVQQYADRLDADGLDMIGRMQSAAGRMSALVRDLLNYSRLTVRTEPFSPVDLNAVLTGVLNDLDLRIRETGTDLRVTALPTLPGNATQLGQLFQNLLSNAMKFQPPNQTPVVRVDSEPAPPADLIAAGLNAGAPYHKISIQDNGIGFSEQHAERIFTVFERLHGKNAFAGTGVGLAVCRRVTESHGGRIRAFSQPGAGATFVVYLPMTT